MTKEELKQYIDQNVYENQDGDITGEALNDVLKAIVDNGGTKVEANPTGEATDTLGKLKIGETIYTAPQGPQGEQGPANTLSIGTVTDGEQASASITGEAPNQQLNLVLPKGEQGDPGQNAVNPFKGWFTTDNIPTTGQEGDYCNVSNTSVTPHTVTIYRWDATQNAFVDTGEVPDTATGETFASSEILQEVAIDDSHLVNPVNTANDTQPVLAKAEDVMQLKAKLEGVTATEVKATVGEQISGFINGDGVPTAASSGSTTTYVVIPLNNAKSVRLLGSTNGSTGTNYTSYAFWNSATYVDSNTVVEAHNFDIREGSTNYAKEYNLIVPNGATHIAVSLLTPTNQPNFYCYLQSGDTVMEEINAVSKDFDEMRKTKSPCVFEYAQGLYISPDGVINTASSGSGNSYQIAFTKVNENDTINFVAIPSLTRLLSNNYTSRIRVGFTREIPYKTLPVNALKIYSNDLKFDNAIIVRDSLVAPLNGYFCVYYTIVNFTHSYDINPSTITTVKKDNQIGVCQGRVLNGYPDGDMKYVTSDYIKGGVYFDLVCREGYKINSVNLYDDSGNLICANFWGESCYKDFRCRNREGWGSILPPHIMARVTLIKNSEGCTADEDCLVADRPIKSLTYLNEANGYTLDIPQAVADVYPIVKYRALSLINVLCRYLHQRENYRIAETGLNHGNDYYELSNRQYYGVAYSDSRLKPSTVGIDVSLYTYITALSHKYSVVYTEDTFTNTSSYGITYPLGNSFVNNNYYNMACNMYYAYCMGLYALRTTSNIINSDYTPIFIGSGSPSGLISDDIQALDVLIKSGHIALILDVIKKENETKYIVVAESTTPFVRITVFPKDDFDTYYMSNLGTVESPVYYNIYRKNQIDVSTYAQPFDLDNGDYVAHYNNEYPYVGSEKECMLYVGDRASLSTADPVFVNVHRGTDKYTKLNIYKDNVLLQSVDITSLTAWTNDPDGEDWVKVDLSAVVDGYGKYKAQASNADDSETSNETIWEIINVELSVSGDTANFSVNGGVPYMLQEEKKRSGFLMDGQCDLLEPSDTSHDISDYTGSTSYYDLALYAMGDYGMVKKIVSRS